MSLTVLFIYALFIGLFIGALWRPIFGVLGYLSVYMLYNPNIWWGGIFQHYLPRPSLIAATFLIGGAFLHTNKLNWSLSRREIEFYLFLGLCWLSTYASGIGVDAYTWQHVMKMTKLFVFVFFFIRIVNTSKDYKLIIWTFILGAIFLSYQAHTISISGRLDRLGGIDFGEANGFAAFLAISIVFLGFQMLRVSWIKKLMYVFGIALMANSIILTQSRAIFLGLLAAIPYVFFRAPSGKLKQIVVYASLGIALFVMLADKNFWDRMSTIGKEIEYSQTNNLNTQEKAINRLDFWKASISIFKDYPLGIGVKNFQKIVPLYDHRNPGLSAHNTYVECYSEIGIFGIVLFFIIIAETFMQIRRIRVIVKGTQHEDELTLHVVTLGTALIIYLFGYMMTHSILYMEIVWILLSMPICLENASLKLLNQNNEIKK